MDLTEDIKLRFIIVIGRSDNSSDRRHAFVIIRRERSSKYTKPIYKLKQDETRTRKYKCPFKLREYLITNNTWTFNVVFGIYNHDLCYKLVGHPIACCLNSVENCLVYDMTLNMVQPKNILATLKHKKI